MLNFCSRFEDIFDVDYFISSLKDQVRILKEIPDKQKRNSEVAKLHPISPLSWSTILYYDKVVGNFNLLPCLLITWVNYKSTHLPILSKMLQCSRSTMT